MPYPRRLNNINPCPETKGALHTQIYLHVMQKPGIGVKSPLGG